MKSILFVVASLMLCGCTIAKNQAEINSYYRGQGVGTTETESPSSDLRNLIQDVARTQATVDTNVDGVRTRGVFTGANGPCLGVSIMRLETDRQSSLRPANYSVCGERIARVGAGEVAPTYPDTADALTTLTNARRNAVLYGSQSVRYSDYVISARRLGVDTSRPCRPVETVITYQGRIVFHDNTEICI